MGMEPDRDFDELLEDDELAELMDGDDASTSDGDGQLYEHLRIEVDRGQVPLRIDKYLTEHTQHSSRNRIQQAAEGGFPHQTVGQGC